MSQAGAVFRPVRPSVVLDREVLSQIKQSVNILVMNHQLWSPSCDRRCAVCLHVAALTRTIDRLEGRL